MKEFKSSIKIKNFLVYAIFKVLVIMESKNDVFGFVHFVDILTDRKKITVIFIFFTVLMVRRERESEVDWY